MVVPTAGDPEGIIGRDAIGDIEAVGVGVSDGVVVVGHVDDWARQVGLPGGEPASPDAAIGLEVVDVHEGEFQPAGAARAA